MKVIVLILVSVSFFARAEEPSLDCKNKEATAFLKKGFEYQKDNNTLKALEFYKKSLITERTCVDALYEIGWSYWKLGEWQKVIEHWKVALKLKPNHEKIPQFLPAAEANLKLVKTEGGDRIFRTNTEILKESVPNESPVQLTLTARWQSYNPKPLSKLDFYDIDIDSPKSAVFSPDGLKVFVNSLEGGKTVEFKSNGLEKILTVSHEFDESNKDLIDTKAPFDYVFKNKTPWKFRGKPVEGVFSHQGKYYWVTYYRRSFDGLGLEPSAMAVIDTVENKIVRVMGTGSISKYIQVSPDGKWLAVSNWGDNTIGVYDIRSKNPKEFREAYHLVVEKKLSLVGLKNDRDKDCGFCVRGLEFSKDSQYLFATRMKGGGIAIFRFESDVPKYLGTVMGIQPGPRDIHLSPDGETLFIGCNSSGTLAKVKVQALVDLVKDKSGENVKVDAKNLKFEKSFVGLGLRSFKVSPNGKYLFAAINNTSEVAVIQTEDLTVLSRVPVDSYPVGLSISPDGTQIWVTSQGKDGKGGNSVAVFQITDRVRNNIHKLEE